MAAHWSQAGRVRCAEKDMGLRRSAGAAPLITFRCCVCEQPKRIEGRKKRKRGFACKACAEGVK